MFLLSDPVTQLAHNVGPSTAHQRYAIEMAYRWRAIGGPTVCAFEVCACIVLLNNVLYSRNKILFKLDKIC